MQDRDWGVYFVEYGCADTVPLPHHQLSFFKEIRKLLFPTLRDRAIPIS